MQHPQGHNWQKMPNLPFSKIVDNLTDEQVLKFNLACQIWSDAAREGPKPMQASSYYENLAHKKLKLKSKDMKSYEEMGKAILANMDKLPQVDELMTRRMKKIKSLNFSHLSSTELLYLFEAVPGTLDNLTTLDLTHINFEKNMDDLLNIIKEKCPVLEDLQLPE